MTVQTLPTHDHRELEPAASALATFVACAQLMLDGATPEDLRLQAEARALTQLPILRALGVFDLFAVRDPALATLIRDELEHLERRDARTAHEGWRRPCAQRA